MNITVLGAGAWGTALAMAAAARHDTWVWARDSAMAARVQRDRVNQRYLPGLRLPDALRVVEDRQAALAHARDGLTVIATPVAGLREQLAGLADGRPALWLCKGFESVTGALGHEIARELRPGASCGVLSGPSFALEVARGQPSALVAASADGTLLATVVEALHGEALRIYTSSDVTGVEVGGAVKNVLAIATGLADGLAAGGGPAAPGLNARAALITRGLAEMTRLGVALGARHDTFMGLSGLGDLVLTCTGELSRNRQVGLALARGARLADVVAHLGHVAEGVLSAPTVLARARAVGVEMPITAGVVAVLQAQASPAEVLHRLMARGTRAES